MMVSKVCSRFCSSRITIVFSILALLVLVGCGAGPEGEAAYGDDAAVGDGEETARQARAEDRIHDAADALDEVAGIDAARAAASELELRAAGRLVGRVFVDARRRALSVLLEPEVRAGAALLRFRAGTEHRLDFRDVPGASYRLAEVEELPDGPFELLLDLDERDPT